MVNKKLNKGQIALKKSNPEVAAKIGFKKGGKAFKAHMMYDKKTGKGVKAPTMAKHLSLKKKGYGHTKPRKK